MVNIDIPNGLVTFAPPALVAGEVGARLIFGLTINELFYLVAILSMLVSTVATTTVAIKKAKGGTKDDNGG